MADSITPTKGPTPDSSSSTVEIPDASKFALIAAPPGPLLALKASVISKVLPYKPADVILANRTFRAVYAKVMHSHREQWLLLPPGVIDEAVAALKLQNPRLFAHFEGDWYLVWGLHKRHAQRWRRNPPTEVGVGGVE